MNAIKVISLAESHIHEAIHIRSAVLCLRDAEALLHKGETKLAHDRAVKSIMYSVGVFHPSYSLATGGM